ncbi:MAG: hemolysin family protein [Melioribacteraceae bacterium]|nr:hemolysin family protein [Melioribacteraceae bacterium]
MSDEFLVLTILVILSAFFSSSELAFVVANRIKIELRARKSNFSAKNAQFFVNNPSHFFSTILISNNIINIAFASLSAVFLLEIFGLNDLQVLVVTTVVLLLFGELIPKYFAREFADTYVTIAATPLRIVWMLIYPFVVMTSKISNLLTKSENMNEDNLAHLFDREDIQLLLDESSEAGKVDLDDSDIINKIMELREQRVYECMTPRTDISGIEINSSIEDAIKIFTETGYSKIPIYEENLDNIKGILLAYDMFKFPAELRDVTREVIFVPDTKRSLEMLNEFLDKRMSIAIVVDEFGGTAGVVTVEDIIEEMFGEIQDEYDVDENVCKKVDDNVYVISGKVEIDYVNDHFALKIPEGDYETIGGYITSGLGRIPDKGEQIDLNHFKVNILHSDKTKISLVKIQYIPEFLEHS